MWFFGRFSTLVHRMVYQITQGFLATFLLVSGSLFFFSFVFRRNRLCASYTNIFWRCEGSCTFYVSLCFLFSSLLLTNTQSDLILNQVCFLLWSFPYLELSVRRRMAVCQIPGSMWARGSRQLRWRRAVELLQRTLGEESRPGASADGHRRAANQQWLWVCPLPARCQLR